MIAILVIGLIVLGPEKLPDAIRKFGNIYGELRRMSHGFQSELRDAFDEPMQALRGTAQMVQDAVNQPMDSITERKAPVAGGGAPPATPDETGETQAPVEEDVDGSSADEEERPPAGSAAAAWEAELDASANGHASNGLDGDDLTARDGTAQRAPSAGDGEQPAVAEAGLMVSEPEMPSDAALDDDRPD